MVHGHVDVIGQDDEPLPDETARHRELFSAAHRNGVTYAGYAFDCRCFSSALTARVEAIRSVGLYDPALLLDDYDLYLRLALAWKIVFLEGSPVARYRHWPGQMTTYELTQGQIQTAEKHLALIDANPDIPDAQLARRNFLLMLARSHAVLGRQKESRRDLVRALRLDPTLLVRQPWVARRLVAEVRSLTSSGRRRRCEAGGHSANQHGPGEHRAVSGVSLSRSPAPPGGSERRPMT